VKKFLIFFILICLIGCSKFPNRTEESAIIDCPRVFFSSENNRFAKDAKEEINQNDIKYVASLNNFGFINGCFIESNSNNYNLDLLIIVDPINPKSKDVSLPLFVLIYDFEDNLVDSQYFKINGELNYNNETSTYTPTEISGNLKILSDPKKKISSLTVGFVKIK